jgi:hypothetical protein
VAYGNGQFVVVSAWGGILTSTNGVNWVQRYSSDFQLNGIAYGNGQFVAVGQVNQVNNPPLVLTSTDGLSWLEHRPELTARSAGFSAGFSGVVYGNGQFVAVGKFYLMDDITGGVIATSTNGVSWVERWSASGGRSLSSVAYGNGQFAAVGGGILTSSDGANWVLRQSEYGLTGIAYGDGHFVAVGPGGTILQSGSIITLTVAPKPSSNLLTLSLEGPTGQSYTIQSSTDLISWQNLTNITTTQTTSVILDALPAGSERSFYRAYSQ